jgi:transcriptional regulator with XRE-family HTH domain
MLNIEALKTKRWQRGETQKALAERAGISENALNHLEQGKSQPRVSTVKRLADALGVPVSELLCDDDDSEREAS